MDSHYKPHLQSMAQLLISGLGLLFFLGSSTSLLIVAAYTAFESDLAVETVYPFISSSYTTFFFSLLTIPSILFAASRLINLKLPTFKIEKFFSIRNNLPILGISMIEPAAGIPFIPLIPIGRDTSIIF